MMEYKAVIDGDWLLWRCASDRTIYELYFDGCYIADVDKDYQLANSSECVLPRSFNRGFESIALQAETLIHSICEAIGTQDIVICFSNLDKSTNLRYNLPGDKYKNNRTKSRPSKWYKLRDYLMNRYPFKESGGDTEYPHLILDEGDDVMAFYAHHYNNCVLVTVDKDLLQVPGRHYNPVTGACTVITKEGYLELKGNKLVGGGLKWFCAQMLMGDCCDTISGLKGFGCKKTYEALSSESTFRELLRCVYDLYMKHSDLICFICNARKLWMGPIVWEDLIPSELKLDISTQCVSCPVGLEIFRIHELVDSRTFFGCIRVIPESASIV